MANVESTFDDLFNAPPPQVEKEIIPANELEKTESSVSPERSVIEEVSTESPVLSFSSETSVEASKSEFVAQIEDAKIKSSQLTGLKSQDELFNEIVCIAEKEVKSLNLQTNIDQQKVREFLDKEMSYDSDASPSNLSKQLVAVQMCKDQVIKICSEAHANYTYIDRTYDILLASYPSSAKTADMRKTEASLKLARLALDCAKAEKQYNYCKDLMDTLESRFKTLSRQITCVQLSIAIGEVQTVNSGSDPKAFIKEIMDEQKKENSEPGSREW